MSGYLEFLDNKITRDPDTGIQIPGDMPSDMKPHQAAIVTWALRRGRAAIFAGTGLGKTYMELVWADRVARHTNLPVLIYAPLAVSIQHMREAQKFGIDAQIVRDQSMVKVGVNIANYEKMDHFDHSSLGGIVLDESSILKHHQGKTRTRLIQECQKTPFRLAATATPAPNDFMELGNHAEFLGVMKYTDMLSTFFTHDGGETQKWRLKGHAETAFWQWMCSWAVMLRSPSDLGFDATGYDLPKLHQIQHTVKASQDDAMDAGFLFPMTAQTMSERISARKATVDARVGLAAQIHAQSPDETWMWWANLNAEADAVVAAIPGAVQVSGSDTDEAKEEKVIDFIEGRIKTLVSKGSIMGFGLNFQHCRNTGLVGMNDSFEQIYQIVRRFWRFGQTQEVYAHFIASEIEGAVVANIRRKEADAERMAVAMVRYMADLSSQEVLGSKRTRADYNPTQPMELPKWI